MKQEDQQQLQHEKTETKGQKPQEQLSIPNCLVPQCYQCPVCLDVLQEPITLPCCKNSVCQECFDQTIALCTSFCPFCKRRLVGFARKAKAQQHSLVNLTLKQEILQVLQKLRTNKENNICYGSDGGGKEENEKEKEDGHGKEEQTSKSTSSSDIPYHHKSDLDSQVDAKETLPEFELDTLVTKRHHHQLLQPGELREYYENERRKIRQQEEEIAYQATMEFLKQDKEYQHNQRHTQNQSDTGAQKKERVQRQRQQSNQSPFLNLLPFSASKSKLRAAPGTTKTSKKTRPREWKDPSSGHFFQRKQQQQQQRSDWICSNCTVKNTGWWLRCQVCDYSVFDANRLGPREKHGSFQAVNLHSSHGREKTSHRPSGGLGEGDASPSRWTCATCTFVNDPEKKSIGEKNDCSKREVIQAAKLSKILCGMCGNEKVEMRKSSNLLRPPNKPTEGGEDGDADGIEEWVECRCSLVNQGHRLRNCMRCKDGAARRASKMSSSTVRTTNLLEKGSIATRMQPHKELQQPSLGKWFQKTYRKFH